MAIDSLEAQSTIVISEFPLEKKRKKNLGKSARVKNLRHDYDEF